MVFGQCLRSLLEHQKNPKKPIEKYYKNSLLTRYLQDYMEGKKQMALILTVKAAEEDYIDTSCILRQASPYMKIKFNLLQENKKRNAEFIEVGRQKKRKIDIHEASLISGDHTLIDVAARTNICEKDSTGEVNAKQEVSKEFQLYLQKIKRSEEVMTSFARALLRKLKQYKHKLEESQKEVQCLKVSLKKQTAHATELEKELNKLKIGQSDTLGERSSKALSFNHENSMPQILTYSDCLKETEVLLDEINFLSPETLEESERDRDENGESLDDNKTTDVMDELCSPVHERPLQQVESSVEASSILHLDEKIECLEYPKNFSNLSQVYALVGEIKEEAINLSDVTSSADKEVYRNAHVNISVNKHEFSEKNSIHLNYSPPPIFPHESEGCNLSSPENKEISIMQLDKYLGENPEFFQILPQSSAQVGEVKDDLNNMPDVESLPGSYENNQADIPANNFAFSAKNSNLLGCFFQSTVPQESEGIILHLPEKESISIMQAKKDQSDVIASLTETVPLNISSLATEIFGIEEDPAIRPVNPKIPKRKLLPTSTILLKDFNGLQLDENASVVKRRKTANAKERSAGSISLIRILTSNLPR